MILFNPKKLDRHYPDQRSREIMRKTVKFFENKGLGGPDARWDTWRNCEFNEILSFYGLAYWYTWQVSILGLGPIWMTKNETARKRAAKLLKNGAVFAFGLSEKDHGADIYSTEMSLTPDGPEHSQYR